MKQGLLVMAGWLMMGHCGFSQSIVREGIPAVVERGTYHNYFNCESSAYAIFANFGDDSGADSRLGQFLVGWDTAEIVPSNQPATRYLIRYCRAVITINDGNQVVYDPTHDELASYFNTNNPAWQPDADPGRPVELFGVGFRNGYGVTNFLQCSQIGNGMVGSNNVFAISWTTNGQPQDVGNNVGKTLPEYLPFETWPFAVAQTTNVAPGQTLSANHRLTFELNLADPFLAGYLQRALQKGRLDLMVSSLHQVSGQFGTEPYPSLATRFNQALLDPPTTLDLEVTVVRDIDTDADGLPDDWEQFYFSNLTNTASGDFDDDSASNIVEFQAGTNPTLATSVFKLTTVALIEGATPKLSWPNLPSRRFEVDYSESLTGWQTITNPVLRFPTAGTAEWADPTQSTARFYRVRAMP